MAFDRLEIYYGIGRGRAVPTNPKYAVPEPQSVPQLLVARAFAPDDVQTFPTTRTSYTVWIPDGGQNDELGAYALAIAYVGQQRVGIAELFDFAVPTDDIVAKYEMQLETVGTDAIYEWGRGDARCLRVQRPRGTGRPVVVSIVDPLDSDCDRFPDRSATVTDCEPLLYCDGSGQGACLGQTPCVHAEATCAVGSCSNADGASVTCADETCVSDVLCTKCDLTRSPAEILECALLDPATHPSQDIKIPVQGTQQLCSAPTVVDIELPFPCTLPTIDAISYYMPSAPFEFRIETGPAPTVCRLTIVPISDDHFTGVPHLLVTVNILGGRRTGFVVGLMGEVGPCPSSAGVLDRTYDPDLGSCPVPRP